MEGINLIRREGDEWKMREERKHILYVDEELLKILRGYRLKMLMINEEKEAGE